MKSKLSVVLFLLLAALAPAAAQMMEGEGMMEGESSDQMMGAGMRRTTPVRTERDYINQMIPHHGEAMDAAILVNVTTADSAIRSLSEKIYTEQAKEIIDLKKYHAKLYSALPRGDQMMAMMRDLNTVSGRARDIQFVQDMIPHHQGAVTMSEEVLRIPSISEETRAFAQKVIKDQTEEIAVMKDWLEKNS